MSEPPASSNGRRRRLFVGLTLALALAAAAYTVYWFTYGRFHVSTDDAYVAGNRVAVMTEVPGTVTEIMADSTDAVRAGQPLVKLDPASARIALDQAEAELATAVRHTQDLFGEIPALQAQKRSAAAALRQARRNWMRAQRFFRGKALARARLEQAHTDLIEAAARAAEVTAKLGQAQDLIHGTRVNDHPSVLAAEAAVRQAYITLDRKTVRAPVSGYVAKRSVELGEEVVPGRPLMIIVPLADVWVDANFKERELRDIRIGQPARVIADWYGNSVVFHGHVAGIDPGSGSAFSLLPPENASGNWIKVVQRVPVRIAIDAPELKQHPLRIGLSTEVSISIRHLAGTTLARHPPSEPRYRTDIYEGLLRRADKLVQRIVLTNLVSARH
ncbi:MAG: HlyD family secretion protein [Acidiferrobacteraceae bacterium]